MTVWPVTNAEVVTHALDERLRIDSNGRVLYMPQRQIDFHCEFDVSLFPFDTHRCVPHFESLRYNINLQRFHKANFELTKFRENGHWTVEIGDAYHIQPEYQSGIFSAVEFVIVIKRKPLYYAISLILPLAVISIVELATFALPITSGDRLQLSFTTLLAFSFFSSTILTELPHNSEHMPILLIIVNVYTAAIAVIIIFQGLSIHLARTNRKLLAKRCNYFSICLFASILIVGTFITACVLPTLSTAGISI